MKKMLVGVTLATAIGLMPSAAGAEGPPKDPFYEDSNAWACEGAAGLPANHCINAVSNGNVGVIKVFAPDERWPQESISTDPKSDDRPCPHDPAATDGTWWAPFEGVWVCHHRP